MAVEGIKLSQQVSIVNIIYNHHYHENDYQEEDGARGGRGHLPRLPWMAWWWRCTGNHHDHHVIDDFIVYENHCDGNVEC